MAERVCILSKEAAFAQMLRLELEDAGCRATVLHRETRLPQADVYLIDRDAFPAAAPHARVVGYGKGTPTDAVFLSRPFALTALLFAIEGEGERACGLALSEDGRAAYLDGTRIPLTEKEYALLTCLVHANGAPLSRSELLQAVWGGEKSEGVVTVYLHYLRKKLERGGKKMIYAVRGSGYALRMEENV